MGHLAMAHIQYRTNPFHMDTAFGVSSNSMDWGLNPADKQYRSSDPLAYLALADMAHVQSRPSTSYRDAIWGFIKVHPKLWPESRGQGGVDRRT